METKCLNCGEPINHKKGSIEFIRTFSCKNCRQKHYMKYIVKIEKNNIWNRIIANIINRPNSNGEDILY